MSSGLDPQDPYYPARVAAFADELEARLGAPETLRSAATAVADAAHRLKCEMVVGASPVGERLAAAAATLAGDLAVESPASAADRVLIVDGVLVTGFSILQAAAAARAAGAKAVYACVISAEPGAHLDSVVDGLEIAELRAQ